MKTKKIFLWAGLLALVGMGKANAQNNVIFQTATGQTQGQFNTMLGENAGLNSSASPSISAGNVFIGFNSGLNTFNGYNTFLGFQSGMANTFGDFNTFIGYESGRANTEGRLNTFLGARNTGVANTLGSQNVFIGSESAQNNTTGSGNTFLGVGSGRYNISGSSNVFLGPAAGNNNATGNNNISIGASGPFNGSNNILIGGGAGANCTGSDNLMVGRFSGQTLSAGNFNTFLGRVDLGGTDPTNTLILATSSDWHSQRVYIDPFGNTGIGLGDNVIPQNRLEINAAAGTAGLVTGTSGLRFRGFTNTNFSALTSTTTPKVLSVNGNGDVILVDDAGGTDTGNDWHTTGNDNITAANFMGTLNNADLIFRRFVNRPVTSPPTENRVGYLTDDSVYFGRGAGRLGTGTLGVNNVCIGNLAGSVLNTSAVVNNGSGNVFVGNLAGRDTNKGNNNVFIGSGAGSSNVNGRDNIFIGTNAGNNLNATSDSLIIANTTDPTPLIAGNFGGATLTLNVDGLAPVTNSAASRVIINSGGTDTSGLRFVDLTRAAVPTATNTEFLTVDTAGDVVLENICNLYTCDGTLNGDRTVSMDNHRMMFNTATNGRIYIGNTSTVADNLNFPTTTGDYRLYVEGGILTEKVKVALRNPDTNWKDSVFAEDYKLMPLKEVEAFVRENKHLPGIESGEELECKGLDLADMQAKQMGKIEELTLHVIEQNKALEKQSQEIEELKAQVKALMEKSK